MRLNIKNKETDRLVRELTALTGESITTAVTEALREKLSRVKNGVVKATTCKSKRGDRSKRKAPVRG
jgi:hypothetical protein